jgi:hypothetical protein
MTELDANESLPTALERSAIVVAHPDDEVLWFCSVLHEVDHVLFCYEALPGHPELSRARSRLAAEYPLENVTRLLFDESGVLDRADWENPVLTGYGLEVHEAASSLSRYAGIFPELVRRLTVELAPFRTIFTHNPWGEYGHEEHVQVHRAVGMVQALHGFDCWHSGYVSAKSRSLMLRYGRTGENAMRRSIDQEQMERYVRLYKRCGCWTWHDDWERLEHETFYRNIVLQEGPGGKGFRRG